MNKNNFIKHISQRSDQKRKKCGKALDIVTGMISKSLKNGVNVLIDNFGSFIISNKETEVRILKNHTKVVTPPENFIFFNFAGNRIYSGELTEYLSKSGIAQAISAELKLIPEAASKLTENIFSSAADCFRNYTSIFIPKFGEFKPVKRKSEELIYTVEFFPSKKLSKKINCRFNNLKQVKLNFKELYSEYSDKGLDYVISEEFRNKYKEICSESETLLNDEETIITEPEVRKKLISDELIELHKEIVNPFNGRVNDNKTNLWG